MPMVAESSPAPKLYQKVYADGHPQGGVTVPNGRSRTQTGFRTRQLDPLEIQAFENASSWGNSQSLIEVLDQTSPGYAQRSSRAFLVHDRDYTELETVPGDFSWAMDLKYYTGSKSTLSRKGQIACTGLSGSLPPWPSNAALSSMAGSMFRQSVPGGPQFNLTRSIGELKDAHLMFRAANYRPKNIKQVAGSYLNYVFGVKATADDILKAADTVISTVPIVSGYIQNERMRIRSNRSRMLNQDCQSGSTSGPYGGGHFIGSTYNFGMMQSVGSYLAYGDIANYLQANVVLSWVWSYSQQLRSVSTWEMFVPKPNGIEGRLNIYKSAAERLVGEGLTAGTVYDLTPYSWLADWFVDVGGLLHYQQAVADNQVVAVSSCYSVWEELVGTIAVSNFVVKSMIPGYILECQRFTPGITRMKAIKHMRRGGSPYSVGPTWDFSSQQWAILGALGLSRSPGVPIK